MKEQIKIALSKTKLSLLLIASVIFVCIGLWLVFDPPLIHNPILNKRAFILASAIIAILFFGVCAVFLVKKLLDQTPGIVINEQGVTDNSSAVSAGFIPWSDLMEIKVINISGQKFIMLIVKNPEEYINRQTGFIIKKAMQLNFKTYGSPINITANGLKYNFDELYKIMLENFYAYKTD